MATNIFNINEYKSTNKIKLNNTKSKNLFNSNRQFYYNHTKKLSEMIHNNNNQQTPIAPNKLYSSSLKKPQKTPDIYKKIKKIPPAKSISYKTSLKQYLLFSEPGVAKRSLKSIHKDLDKIRKIIHIYEKKENNINANKKNFYDDKMNSDKLIVNIPFSKNSENDQDNICAFYDTYKKYNNVYSKIKRIFNTSINLYEQKELIKSSVLKNEDHEIQKNDEKVKLKTHSNYFPLLYNKNKFRNNKTKPLYKSIYPKSFKIKIDKYYTNGIPLRSKKFTDLQKTNKSVEDADAQKKRLKYYFEGLEEEEEEKEIPIQEKTEKVEKKKEAKFNINEINVENLAKTCKEIINKLREQKLLLKSKINNNK